MTLILINNKGNKSLELYFIKYLLNTKGLDFHKLNKIDEQILNIEGEAGQSNLDENNLLDGSYNSSDGPLLANNKNIEVKNENPSLF